MILKISLKINREGRQMGDHTKNCHLRDQSEKNAQK